MVERDKHWRFERQHNIHRLGQLHVPKLLRRCTGDIQLPHQGTIFSNQCLALRQSLCRGFHWIPSQGSSTRQQHTAVCLRLPSTFQRVLLSVHKHDSQKRQMRLVHGSDQNLDNRRRRLREMQTRDFRISGQMLQSATSICRQQFSSNKSQIERHLLVSGPQFHSGRQNLGLVLPYRPQQCIYNMRTSFRVRYEKLCSNLLTMVLQQQQSRSARHPFDLKPVSSVRSRAVLPQHDGTSDSIVGILPGQQSVQRGHSGPVRHHVSELDELQNAAA